MGTRYSLKFPFLRELLVVLAACAICLSVAGKGRSCPNQDPGFLPSTPIITLEAGTSREATLIYTQYSSTQPSNTLKLQLVEPVKISIRITEVDVKKGMGASTPVLLTLGIKRPNDEKYESLGLLPGGKAFTSILYEAGVYSLSYDAFGGLIRPKSLSSDGNMISVGGNVYTAHVEIKCEAVPKEAEISPYPPVLEPTPSDCSRLIATVDKNYVATFDRTKGGGDLGMLSVQYYDDFGKEEETVGADFVSDGKDLVAYQEYDEWERKGRSWYPISIPSASRGGYVPLGDFLSHTQAGANAYPVYEESLEEKTLKLFGDGHEWQSRGICRKFDYFTNKEGRDSLACLSFRAKPSNGEYAIVATGVVPAGTLLVTRTEDEDGHATFTFKDVFDRLLLQRQVEYTTKGKVFHDTYYVYGMMDKLLAVIPPALADCAMVGEALDREAVARYAYCYLYDGQERNIAKKLPGCAWMQMGYDKADRLVFSQDGEQRKRGSATFWLYDIYGRKCVVGTCNAKTISSTDAYMHCKYVGKDKSLGGYEAAGLQLANPSILSVNYYDNHDFLRDAQMDSQLYGRFMQESGYAQVGSISQDFLTGTIRKIMGDNEAQGVQTVLYYDSKGRVAQRRILNYELENEVVSYAYDFTESPLRIKRIYDTNTKSTEEYRYEYDSHDRPLSESLCIDNGETVTLNSYEYDELGRVRLKKHADNDWLTTAYTYNNRSWLTELKGELFSEALHYQEKDYGKKLYSGKISSMDWKEREKAYVNTYDLDYDQLGRLTSAKYNNRKYYNSVYCQYDKMGNVTSLTRSGERDNNHYGTIDILDYSYDGNQVVKVSDKESGPHFKGAFHFVDGADEDIEYTYDANGNMTRDLNKGIQSIEYNVLNLPVAVNFKLRDDQTGLEEKKSIEYFYDSDGGKRAVLYTDGETSTDDNTLCYSYTENRTFEDGELRQILFNGGYVTFKEGKPQYHFYLQDHLGNNRIMADSRGNIEQINTYYPFGALIQGGFSEDITSTQRYKYNGKELDRMFGIDSYDYGARMYDPCMIRWRSLDPLCEKYYSISPYAYCANDPINFLDKDGKRPSLYEAALIARHVYYGKGHLVGNWQLHGKIIEKDNGLQYGIYYRKLKNGNMDYVLAFAGTNDKRDIEQDINQALGNGSVSQFGNAKSISEKFQTSHKNGDQTIIGHSLGGGLATIGSLTTGIPAITFNPAALHQNTKRLLDIDRAEDSQILNFVVKGEIVDKVQKVLRLQTDGHTCYISNKESEEMDSLDKHKIDNVIQILKKR